MERARGEGVGVHHVGEGRGVGELACVRGGEGERVVKCVAVFDGEVTGRVLGHIRLIIVAAGSRELVVVAVVGPYGVQQLESARGLAVIAAIVIRLAAAGGEGESHRCGQQQGEKLFHGNLPPKCCVLSIVMWNGMLTLARRPNSRWPRRSAA